MCMPRAHSSISAVKTIITWRPTQLRPVVGKVNLTQNWVKLVSYSPVHETLINLEHIAAQCSKLLSPYPNQAFLCSQYHLAQCPPPPPPQAKTLFPFSEFIQVKFFWKFLQKWISRRNFCFHGNHRLCKVVQSFPFFAGNSFSNIKSFVPLLKVNKSNFSESLEKPNRMTPFL